MTAVDQNIPQLKRKPVAIKQGLPSLRLAVYGEGGVGKTTLALSFPHPLVIDTDGGLEGDAVVGLDPAKGDEWRPEKWRDLNALFFWLQKEIKAKGYETIVLDSISELCILILHESMEIPTSSRKASAENDQLIGAELQDYGRVAYAVDNFLTKLKLLSKSQGVHIVITSGVRDINEEKGIAKRTFDVQDAVQQALYYWANIYGELTYSEVSNKVTKEVESRRVLHTRANDPRRRNKTRFSVLLPGVKDPTFGKISNLIQPKGTK